MVEYARKIKQCTNWHPWRKLAERSKSLLAGLNALSVSKEDWIHLSSGEVLTRRDVEKEYILCVARLKLVPRLRGLDESEKDLTYREAITLCLRSDLVEMALSIAKIFDEDLVNLVAQMDQDKLMTVSTVVSV
jgi:hypothetical protein